MRGYEVDEMVAAHCREVSMETEEEARERKKGYQVKYRETHREEIRKRNRNNQRRYRENERDIISEDGLAMRRVAARKRQRKWRETHSEMLRERDRMRRKENPERHNGAGRKWYEAHRNECNAERRANRNIPLAVVCEICGARAQHRHHPDYSQPLLVLHVCAKCHSAIHAKHGQEKKV